MTLQKIKVTPGFNSQLSQTANESGWFSGNLVRWKNGLLEKIGGWQRLISTTASGIIRFMHGWEDLQNTNDLLIGTDAGPQLLVDGVLYTLSLASPINEIFGTKITGFVGNTTVVAGGLISTTGNTTITIASINLSLVSGKIFTTSMLGSFGNVIVPAQTGFTVTSITALNATTVTYTFNMATTAATTSLVNLVPQARFLMNDAASLPSNVKVLLNAHGLSNGQFFTIDKNTTVNFNAGISWSLSLTAGTTIGPVGVIDTNNFTVNLSSSIGGSWQKATVTFAVDVGANIRYIAKGSNVITAISTDSSMFNFATDFILGTEADWFLDNLGTNGLIVYTNSPIYVYMPPISNGLSLTNAGGDSPQANAGMFVAMPQAQVIVFGTEPVIGTGQTDPLLIRFSDAGDYTTWTASVSNQAGSYRLSRGSKIIGGLQAPQTTLIFTDIDCWSMSYIGPPLVYGFTIMGTGCGLVAAHAATTLGRTTYWQGQNSFWSFGDNGVQPLPCPVWDIIFTNLNTNLISKCFAGANSSFHEVWFFYPSLQSTGECDSYVKYNAAENLWDYGSLNRTSWIDNSVFGPPLGSDTNFLIQQHEIGYDNDGSAMTGVFAETGYAQVSEGDQMMYIDMVVPDIKWIYSPTTIHLYPGNVLPAGNVQVASGSPSAPTQYAAPAGQVIVVILRGENANAITSLTDSAGNSYTVGVAANDGTGVLELWWTLASTELQIGGTFTPVVATGANYQIKGAYSIPCTGIDQAIGTTGAGTTLTLTTGNLATAKEIAIGSIRNAAGTVASLLAFNNPPPLWPTLIKSFLSSAYANMTTTITTTPLTYNPSWSPTAPFNQAVLATFPLSSTINTGSMNLTMKYQAYPGDTQSSIGPFTITPSLEFQTFHLRSRQVAMHLDWATATGFTARVEAIRFRVSPSGKRP